MPTPVILYLASILGAIALLMMMPKRRLNLKPLGALLGAATVGGLWLFLARNFDFWTNLPAPPPPGFGGDEQTGVELSAFAFHYVFGFIAIAASVAVITNRRPVYAALWFVMVVLASAGMFITLAAEFIAFAMVIIYGGAILVTYMFVIMLASEQQQSTDLQAAPEYERIAREPFAAVAAGFLLLAVLLNITFEPLPDQARAPAETDATLIATTLPQRSESRVGDTPLTPAHAAALDAKQGGAESLAGIAPEKLSNVERVGLDLFKSHPLGLELAGVVLLVALIGAVVIAKTQVPDEDDHHDAGPPTGPGGATVHPRGEPGPYSPEVVEATGSGKVGH
jgi:NADH-quinone oxidoreductase subunit J